MATILRFAVSLRKGSEGFRQYVREHVRAKKVGQFDVSFARLVRQEVVSQVDVPASLFGAGIAGDTDGRLVVNEKGGRVGAEHAHLAEDIAYRCSLLDGRCGGDILDFACEEGSDFLLYGAAADGGRCRCGRYRRLIFGL